ncbi:uncharacterized protein LOC126831740 [Patella vulgata]|uniref:uncharacterized protein LOC126831740 n=1 Tax=Patella vulgata TaxID=6465 RepID=UPI0024A9C05A|nr:uncharacterized protein LOC126831740 [Patella vulgata]XP_050418349.2 uncharacterized protein LOC126831740 [Patella vulgata]
MRLTNGEVDTTLSCFWKRVGSSSNQSPRSRFKHSSCVHGNYVYIYGGKDGTQPLKDLWRFDTSTEEWDELDTHGSELGHLQGHTLVSYKRLILIFGGEFTNTVNTAPLWIYNPDLNHIRKCWCDQTASQPCGRREHTAVIYNNNMYIYGGFIDIKGSTSELWQYSIDEEEWCLLPSPRGDSPGNRHGHSAVVRANSMWIYGGMKDLTVKTDLWRYNFISGKWFLMKSVNGGPPPLTGHTVVMVSDNMLIFGGENQGKLSNDIWSYHFESSTWTKLEHDNRAALPSITQHSTVVIQNYASHKTEGGARTSSVPHLQRKKIRSSQYSLPDRPQSTPPSGPANASSVNFHNKIFPATSDDHERLSDFCLQSLTTVTGDVGLKRKTDKQPLLDDSSGNLSLGYDNCVKDILSDETDGVQSDICEILSDKDSHLYKKASSRPSDLCSKCLVKHKATKPKIEYTSQRSRICRICSEPLRRSRHESDIFIEDLEQVDDENQNETEPLPNSFYVMHHDCSNNQNGREIIELDIVKPNSGKDNCDIVSCCSKCNFKHICNGDNCSSVSLFLPSPSKEFTSIATQTDDVIHDVRRPVTESSRQQVYEVMEDSRSDIADKNITADGNNIQVIIFGGKTSTTKTTERCAISIWKLSILL